ncbi:MAG: sigma-70 family RNA polymerase sigma factor, partial [Muribaculaceae bacterium]|nr:sigma-70 family RNA polymerase sigma factor [Muribaculaceae bacterium]
FNHLKIRILADENKKFAKKFFLMKLSGLNMHLMKQNKLNMKSPPINEREFALLIQEHSRIINKVCYFYATDKMPFDDLRQEIYVNIWLSLNQFRGESKMSTWIYRVAVNSALMAIRSSKPRIETLSLDFGLLDVSTELDDSQRENLQTLQSLINRLEDIEKAIILLWLDEYSYDEIAETLGMKRNTIAVKIHRIKEKLSKQI